MSQNSKNAMLFGVIEAIYLSESKIEWKIFLLFENWIWMFFFCSGLCLEKRVYYRIISAFHTSITVQVCANHYQPPVGAFGSGKWVPNIEMFKQRFSEEATGGEGPSRLKVNLEFKIKIEAKFRI